MKSSPLRMDCKICMDMEVWFIPTLELFGIDCRMVLVLCCGMFCGLNWEDIVAGGQGLFRDGFGSKLACTGAAKELSGTSGCGSHAVAWLGASSGTPGSGIHVVAWLGAFSGTL